MAELVAAVANGLQSVHDGKEVTYLVFIQEQGKTELSAMPVVGRWRLQALQANSTFLNSQADDLKEAFDYPGCELVKKKV